MRPLLLCAALAFGRPAYAGPFLYDFDGAAKRPATGWSESLPAAPAAPPAPARASSAQAAIVAASAAGQISEAELWARLDSAQVVYVGEQHNLAAHHGVQLLVLKALHARKPGLVVGLEMVEYTEQKTLDQYLAGNLSDADMEKFWKKEWGWWELYRPILEYARANGVAVRGLNAPKAAIHQIYKGGLASLSPDQRKLLPARINPITDSKYLAATKKTLEEHAPGDPALQARMLEAQTAWNETMGQSVEDILSTKADTVLVLAGSGHVIYDAGILESVRTRRAASQAVVLPYPLDDEQLPLKDLLKSLLDKSTGELELGDYFWLLPK